MALRIAICIVGFRNFSDICRCLEALGTSTHVNFEIVICENGGNAAYALLQSGISSTILSGQPVKILQADENPGYAGGINICMHATGQADAWWILNPDTVPDANALERLAVRLARGDCDVVASTVHYANGLVESRGGRWNPWLARAVSLDHGATIGSSAPVAHLEKQVNYASGASMLVSRRFLERVGPMREEYFLYAEEVEWCLRGVAAGLKLGIAVDACVLHHQGSSTGSVTDITKRAQMPVYLDERNKMLLTRDLFPARMPVAATAAFLLLFLRFGRRAAWRQLGYGLAGWWAGLRNERGKPSWIAD